MARKYGTTQEEVVDAASGVLRSGRALSLASVSEAAGISSATIYHHVEGGLDGLERLVAVRVAGELVEAMDAAAAVNYGRSALVAVVTAATDWVLEHTVLFDVLRRHADHVDVADAWSELHAPAVGAALEAGDTEEAAQEVGYVLVTMLCGLATHPSPEQTSGAVAALLAAWSAEQVAVDA